MNILKGKRLFNTSMLYASATPYPTIYSGITNDTTVIVPAGFKLDGMMFLNSMVNDATISCGTTAGGTEVFVNNIINGSGTENGLTYVFLSRPFNMLAATTLYIHANAPGDGWNSANVSIYLFFTRAI